MQPHKAVPLANPHRLPDIKPTSDGEQEQSAKSAVGSRSAGNKSLDKSASISIDNPAGKSLHDGNVLIGNGCSCLLLREDNFSLPVKLCLCY